MDIPQWHETSYDPAQVVNLRTISELYAAPSYSALRSYATGRREHKILGPMPAPVARIANRRLWLLADIEEWLTIPLPKWQRSRTSIAGWIARGRPRPPRSGAEPAGDAARLSGDNGYRPPAP